MEDKKAASDPYTFKNITNGSSTSFVSDNDSLDGFYVANPKYTGTGEYGKSEFEIKLTFEF